MSSKHSLQSEKTQSDEISATPNEMIFYGSLSLEEIIGGYQLSQVIFTLHRLKLLPYLSQKGPQDVLQLVGISRVNAKLLTHLLKVAQTLNLIEIDQHQRYHLTPTGSRLCPDAPDSIIPLLDFYDSGYQAWEALQHSMETGECAFEHAHQMDIYEYFNLNPEKNRSFNRYMQQTTQSWLAKISLYHDFSGHLVDIGGNSGALAVNLLQQNPALQATVLDLEQTMAQARKTVSAAGMSERCQLVTGSFFEPQTIPSDGDIYLISRVLLNWNDDKVVEILKNCRQAMPANSKLLILDLMLLESPTLITLLNSLNLWILFEARLRTQKEFEQLVQQAGFTQLGLTNINETLFLLEASPNE